jgi:hypothetical protein
MNNRSQGKQPPAILSLELTQDHVHDQVMILLNNHPILYHNPGGCRTQADDHKIKMNFCSLITNRILRYNDTAESVLSQILFLRETYIDKEVKLTYYPSEPVPVGRVLDLLPMTPNFMQKTTLKQATNIADCFRVRIIWEKGFPKLSKIVRLVTVELLAKNTDQSMQQQA